MNFTTEYGAPVQLFGWLDILLFLVMLALSTLIGVYFGFWGKKEDTPKEYLHGGKTMSTWPVAVSLVSTTVSGVSLMGVPSEIYRFGTVYCLVAISAILMGIINNYIYLPVFYELQLTSTYEYLQLRFDKRVRVMASVLYTCNLLLYIPIVVYVPALVLSHVVGVNLHFITVGTSILCVFYTMLGGLKAVVWTDFLQGIVMLIASIAIIILGVMHSGGIAEVWERNEQGGRIQLFEMDPSPFLRLTFWTVIIGQTINWMLGVAVNQSMVQKFMSLPTFKKAQRSLVMYIIGLILIKFISCFTGLLIFSAYHDCDPIKRKVITRPDQLTTYYVMDIAAKIPGLPGLFVAGIFSASLSTMSSCLNSLGATLFEDFVRPFIKKSVADETINKMIKCVIVAIGAVCLLLVFLVDKMGSILQLSVSMHGVTYGPMLGLFTFGMFYPRANAKGALVGSICGVIFIGWIVFGAQTAIANGKIKLPVLPTSVEGCGYNVTETFPIIPDEPLEEAFILFKVSFMYYTLMGFIVTLVIGAIVSHLTEPPTSDKLNPALFTPLVRKYVIKYNKNFKNNRAGTELSKTSNNIMAHPTEKDPLNAPPK